MSSSDAEVLQPAGQAEVVRPATLAQCHEVIDAMAARLLQLEHKLAELQERLKLNSRNSSKPPSSDGPGGAGPSGGNRAQRRASERRRGAQKGHRGSFRALVDESRVDRVVECAPPDVCECGAAVRVAGRPLRHQVFDVPSVQAQIDEYRLYSGRCTGCGKLHRAALPTGVPRSQIGPRALACIGALGTRYHLTQFKIRDLLAQMLGVDFSVGAISQAHGKVAAALQAPVREARASLRAAPVVHMDETGYPREGTSGQWVWAAIQPKLAVFSIWSSRARYVVQDLIGLAPKGVVVSDRYAAYAYVDAGQRQVCWAHLLRDFRRMGERAGQAGRIGRCLLGCGYVLFRWREGGKTSAEQFEPLQRRVRRALQEGAAQQRCTRTAKTCANLLRLWPALWGFITHPGVEPTNNAAEQALRSMVLKRKISGPTRSRRGDEFIANGFSAHESCRRQGRDLLDYLQGAITAWIDKTTPPSLMPQPTG